MTDHQAGSPGWPVRDKTTWGERRARRGTSSTLRCTAGAVAHGQGGDGVIQLLHEAHVQHALQALPRQRQQHPPHPGELLSAPPQLRRVLPVRVIGDPQHLGAPTLMGAACTCAADHMVVSACSHATAEYCWSRFRSVILIPDRQRRCAVDRERLDAE